MSNYVLTCDTMDDWKEIKLYLKDKIDNSLLTIAEIIHKAGLTRDSYYKMFSEVRIESSMRKTTVLGLARALSLKVHYENGLPVFEEVDDDIVTMDTIHFEGESYEDDFSEEIRDPGLNQLLSPENRRKHDISEEEAQDLLNLAFRRKSMTTLSQWVSILYTLRDLDKS